MIQVTNHEAVRELRLDRPPVNALDPKLMSALARAVRQAPADGVGALVISGRSGVFSGGLDVPHLVVLDPPGLAAALETFFDLMSALAGSELPLAAAITGHSPAGGAVVALFCDWRVMAAGEYVIGFNEVTIGIPMPAVVVDLIARTVGARRAEELTVTGRLVGPAEARELGLVDSVADGDRVVGEAVAWCRQLIRVPGFALAGTRRAARGDLVACVDRRRTADIAALADAWFRPEVQEPLRQLVRRLSGR